MIEAIEAIEAIGAIETTEAIEATDAIEAIEAIEDTYFNGPGSLARVSILFVSFRVVICICLRLQTTTLYKYAGTN